MPDKGLSAIEQARLLDTLIEASNEVIDYKRVLHAYSFDETTTTQNGYIFANKDDESAEQFCARVGSDKLWAVAFVNGDLSMERNYLAACKMTGTIPDDFDKVVILPSGSYVYPAKDTEDLRSWLEHNDFFIVYYFDYNKDECEIDVLADIGPYSIYSQIGSYKDVVYIDSINPQKADMSRLARFWNMIPEECKPRLYQHVASRTICDITAFWNHLFPGVLYDDLMEILSFGKCTKAPTALKGIDIGQDEVVLILPPISNSIEDKVLLQAKEAKVWHYAWRKTLQENGVRTALTWSNIRRHVQNIEAFKQLGRFLRVDQKAEEIFSSGDISLTDLDISRGFSASLPRFGALHEAAEEYMIKKSGRTSLAHVKAEVEKCGFKVEDSKLYALFEEGFAFEAADDHALSDEYDETMYFYYEKIRSFDDVYLSEDPICFALMDANIAWCGLGTRSYQYATALSVLDSSLDKDTGWMIAFSISGDGNRDQLAEVLEQFGTIAYDETNDEATVDVIAGQYSLGPKGPSLSENAVVRKDKALRDRKCGNTIILCMKECASGSRKFSSDDAGYALSIFASMADAFTFSDELGDFLRSQSILSIPNQDINIMLDSMLACIDIDELDWIEKVRYLSDITGIWMERLGQFGLEVGFATYPEEMQEGTDGLRKIGRFLGIDDDLETFKHGVPREDIIA